jgi:chromate transporter
MTAGLDTLAAWLGSPLASTQLLALFGHFLLLGLLSVGGAITTAPDMHRYVVVQEHWLSNEQFAASIAIAQAAPGPNVLFVAAIGWNVAGPLGVLATMVGILIPSTLLSLGAHRWGEARRDSLAVRSFTHGMAPLTLGLLLSTGWILALPAAGRWQDGVLFAFTVVMMLRTRISPIWLVAAGGGVGVWLGLTGT